MLKRLTVFALFAILFLGIPSPALAEEPLKISTMDVSVWPEYDQPGVLVQYQGNLSANADKTNPLELYFFVPKGVGVGALGEAVSLVSAEDEDLLKAIERASEHECRRGNQWGDR